MTPEQDWPKDRELARSLGLRCWVPDFECKRGHKSARLVGTGNCLACRAVGRVRRRLAAADEAREWSRSYYAKKREDLVDSAKAYRERNREKEADRYRRWAAKNNEKVRIAASVRRVRTRGGPGCLTPQDVIEITASQRGRCAYCKIGGSLTIDHIQPLSKGGQHTRRNIQMLCKSCNCQKNNTDPIIFSRKRGLLL